MFVVIEGPDWVGKTTLVEEVSKALKADAHFSKEVIVTKEPGGTKVGKKIREILFDASQDIDPATETLLFLADRAQHSKEVLSKSSDECLIISDRYNISNVVYQALIKRAVDLSFIEKIEKELNFPVPDLVIILTAEKPLGKKEDNFLEKFNCSWNDLNQAYRDFFLEANFGIFNYPKVLIDMTNKTKEETAKIVADIIRAYDTLDTLKMKRFVL